MRLAPSLAALLTFLSLAMTSSFAADSAPKATPFDQALKLIDTLVDKKLPQPEPFGETEYDLFNAMESGLVPVDPAFCERIKLIEITDDLLPVMKQAIPGLSESTSQLSGNILACRLFVLRGLLHCQQGKVAEGQAWLLKPRLMARRPGADQSLIQLLVAIAMDAIGQQAAANYVEIWSEADRLAYIKSSESLTPLGTLHTAILLDGDAFPEKDRMRTMIVEFKSLTPAQQRERLGKHLSPAFPGPELRKEREDFINLHLDIISNLTTETWDKLVKDSADELTPLTKEKIAAFASRNADAKKRLTAETSQSADKAHPRLAGEERAQVLYRVLMGPGAEGVARSRLNQDLKAKLLIVAMQKGTAFDESCLTDLTAADGKPLTLGKHDGVKAILAPGSDAPFLIIGPVK
jgi:hypothetical protein